MERTAVSSTGITGNGALFRFDRPSYQQMLDYSGAQFDMFAITRKQLSAFAATD